MLGHLQVAIGNNREARYDIYLADVANSPGGDTLSNYLILSADEIGICVSYGETTVPIYIPWSGIGRIVTRGL